MTHVHQDSLHVLASLSRTAYSRSYQAWEESLFESIRQEESGLFIAVLFVSTKPRRIHVTFRITHNESASPPYGLFGTCTCGQDICPHAAAVLIELVKPGSRQKSSVVSTPSLVHLHRLSSGAQQLIQLARQIPAQANQLARLNHQPRQPAPTRAVVYCFANSHIVLGSCAYLKRGGLSKARRNGGLWSDAITPSIRPYGYGYQHRLDVSHFNDADKKLIRELFAQGNDLPSGNTLNVRALVDSERFIESLIATGRAYSSLRADCYLSRGDDSALNLAWIPSGEDRWRLAFTLPSGDRVVMLHSIPPWYIDTATGTIGKVTNELLPLSLAAVEASTEIAYDDIEDLQQVIESIGDLAALPALPTIEVIDQGRVTPTAWLELGNIETDWEESLFIKVWFEYPGGRQAPFSGTEIFKTDHAKRYRIERDVAFEEDKIGVLAAIPPLSPSDNSTYLISPDSFDENYLLAAAEFQDKYVPKLIEAGWNVTYAGDFDMRLLPDRDWTLTIEDSGESGWYNARLEATVGDRKVDLVEILRQLLKDHRFVEQVRLGTDTDTDKEWYSRLQDGNIIRVPFNQVQRMARLLLDINDQSASDKPLRLSRFA